MDQLAVAAQDGKLALKKDLGLLGPCTAQGEYSQVQYTPKSHTNQKQNKTPAWEEQPWKITLPSFWIFPNLPLFSVQVPRVKTNQPTMAFQWSWWKGGGLGDNTTHPPFLNRKQRKGPQAGVGRPDPNQSGIDQQLFGESLHFLNFLVLIHQGCIGITSSQTVFPGALGFCGGVLQAARVTRGKAKGRKDGAPTLPLNPKWFRVDPFYTSKLWVKPLV